MSCYGSLIGALSNYINYYVGRFLINGIFLKMKKINKYLLYKLVLIPVTVLMVACATTTAQEEVSQGILQGVFTAEQSQSGKDTFTSICRNCHIPRDFRTIFKQSDDTEALLSDYYDLISTTMPQDSPGSLSEEMYLDVMAYLLSLNGFAASSDE